MKIAELFEEENDVLTTVEVAERLHLVQRLLPSKMKPRLIFPIVDGRPMSLGGTLGQPADNGNARTFILRYSLESGNEGWRMSISSPDTGAPTSINIKDEEDAIDVLHRVYKD